MKNLLIIENDNYFISQRLKEIDGDYFIVYNLNRKKYEVHVKGQFSNSYAFTVPYDRLDERTILFALKTRIENQDKVMREIERENEENYNRLLKQQINLIKEII